MPIKIIDLFAGPGGLGEGFTSLLDAKGNRAFEIGISIEKDAHAHRTLELRAFTRQFDPANLPVEYYKYLRGKLTREELYSAYSVQAQRAKAEAWLAELGHTLTPNINVDKKIRRALGARANPWVLIGGPPCQAYSLVGRSRMQGDSPSKYENDPRHHLYKQYLRILAVHKPPVFVMENVKGLLSATVGGTQLVERIFADLAAPADALADIYPEFANSKVQYSLHPVRPYEDSHKKLFSLSDFLVESEQHGIPQARHRLIIVGVRSDIGKSPETLPLEKAPNIEDVIGDLPKLRSGLSKETDSGENWKKAITTVDGRSWARIGLGDRAMSSKLISLAKTLNPKLTRGSMFLVGNAAPRKCFDWYVDEKLLGFCNHETRTHMRSDLQRYFFASTFAKLMGKSPVIRDFPRLLFPEHENIEQAVDGAKFNDRFRVQYKGRPSTTVVSHISKDGHYYIHYDPLQCRSLTVREAARLQTFPDNYFFDGPRTEQYHQVGNAVPPLLAQKIAKIILKLF